MADFRIGDITIPLNYRSALDLECILLDHMGQIRTQLALSHDCDEWGRLAVDLLSLLAARECVLEAASLAKAEETGNE